MTIASATSDGVPSAHLVVLRGMRRGLVFFTDSESDKGAELTANPQAAAVLHWLVPVHRQVRVAGRVEPVSQGEADEYWNARAPAVRRSAAASRQSRVVASRIVLETQVRDFARRPARPDPLPPRRRRLDHRAAVAVTTGDRSHPKVAIIELSGAARGIALTKAVRSRFGLWTPVDCPRSSLPFPGQTRQRGRGHTGWHQDRTDGAASDPRACRRARPGTGPAFLGARFSGTARGRDRAHRGTRSPDQRGGR